jgi:hypothetical protein
MLSEQDLNTICDVGNLNPEQFKDRPVPEWATHFTDRVEWSDIGDYGVVEKAEEIKE